VWRQRRTWTGQTNVAVWVAGSRCACRRSHRGVEIRFASYPPDNRLNDDEFVGLERETTLRVRLSRTWLLTRVSSCERIIPLGAKKERGRGRPRKRQTRLSRWIDAQKLERGVVAGRLGIARNYLDKLCREEARPSLELAVAIERLTDGGVPAADWLRVLPRSAR
jgi:hypothetical protein